ERLVVRQVGGDVLLDAGAAIGLDRSRLTDEVLAPVLRPAPAAARPSRRRAWIVALVLAAATLALFAWRMA
ncbi:MAG: hypothetical protein IT378_17355, partial [Sandaracinaceae bacterium]|nr:hypothetical protein [Sandaracinaceae bacterium]